MTTAKSCWKCRREVPFESRILRSELCPWCSASLHVCKNCRFHDPRAYNECTEVGTEYVRDRELANHCSAFEFRSGTGSNDDEAEKAKRKLGGLFKI